MPIPCALLATSCAQVRAAQGKREAAMAWYERLLSEVPTDVTLLTERRRLAPYGLQGGEPGKCGENCLLHEGVETILSGKVHFQAQPGDRLTIASPGGGGWGNQGAKV